MQQEELTGMTQTTQLTLYPTWRAAWDTHVSDEGDNAPTAEQAAFMDEHLGAAPVYIWDPEGIMGMLEDYPPHGLTGPVLYTLQTDKDESTDTLTVFSNGVFALFNDEPFAGGVSAAFIRA